VAEEDDEAAHLAAGVLDGALVDLLDQVDDVFVDRASEDHGDRVLTVRAEQAVLLAGLLTVDVEGMERARNLVADLRAGLDGLGGEDAAGEHDEGDCGGTNHLDILRWISGLRTTAFVRQPFAGKAVLRSQKEVSTVIRAEWGDCQREPF